MTSVLNALLLGTVSALCAAASAWFLSARNITALPAGTRSPVLLVNSTFHSRFKPILHSFRYPVLYICVDLDSLGYVNRLFTTSSRRLWRILSLRSEDYLGSKYTGNIKEKLFQHLKDHDVDTTGMDKALLITTPRLFGYSFNPVSFHYIYDGQEDLKIVVLEVNNTFGEKHVYVLKQEEAHDRVRSGYTTAQTFPRKFHVSPFNDRSGSYQLQCRDPLETPDLRVDMHLTLLEADGTKKLTAQVNTTQPAISITSTASCLWALLRYGTAVFLTMPRILRQAYTLHYAKQLSVYMRPEPYEDRGAIGRQVTSSGDLYFKQLWVSYLRRNVEWYPGTRIAIHILPTSEQIDIDASGPELRVLDVTILSTTFFSSLAASESALTCLWTQSMSLECPTFRVSDPLLFLQVLGAGFSGALPDRWYPQRLRCTYHGRPDWFDDAIVRQAPQYTAYLTTTNRGLDNFVHDLALKGELSMWKYRWNIVTSMIVEYLGNAVFTSVATFVEGTGPQDEWVRVRRTFEKLPSVRNLSEKSLD